MVADIILKCYFQILLSNDLYCKTSTLYLPKKLIMIKPSTLFSLFAFFSLAIIFSNCASLTGFQTGRTVGEGNGEFMATLNASQSPDFILDYDFDDTTDVENLFFPNIEVSGRYGIAEKFDMGLRVNTNLNVAVDAKYQLLGDQESEVALAIGAGVGTFSAFVGLWNVQVPLYFSLHPNESVDIYLTPRYISQFATGDLSGSLNYLGGNAGVLFGERVKFGLDAGIYNISATGGFDVTSIATFGIGVKIPFD